MHDELADQYGNSTLRLTSRQGIQFHGVLKGNLRAHLQGLNAALVSTLAACGDVERNVMSCPAPDRTNPIRDQLQQLADRIADHLCPRTTAYADVWLNGEKVNLAEVMGEPKQAEEVVEPIYGKTYLPRKFKTAIGLPEDNCVDLLSNDAGLLAHHNGKEIVGYDLFVGGGMGMSHGMKQTYPRLASPLCFTTPDEAVDVLTAVVKVQRDFGNRSDRKQARMKYLIDKWGIDAFRDKVAEYMGKPLAPYRGGKITGYDDHLGWHDQGDGKLWLGIAVPSGRVQDTDRVSMRTTLRDLIKKYQPAIRITAQQNILLCDVDPANKSAISAQLRQAGVIPADELSIIARNALSCPAMPTCALALSDSERAMPGVMAQVEAELAQLGMNNESLSLRMTGCPNGCVRPYNSDIGVVGRQPGIYTLFVGGNMLADTLSFELMDMVKQDQIGAVLRGPLLQFKSDRQADESFGQFCTRVGKDRLIEWSRQHHGPDA